MSHRKKKNGGLNTPSFRERPKAPIHEIPPHPQMVVMMINGANSYLRTYLMGDCSVVVTREFGDWHLSIDGRTRYPTWNEVAEAWYRLIPGAENLTGALMLPPLHQYVNVSNFCMQVHQIKEPS